MNPLNECEWRLVGESEGFDRFELAVKSKDWLLGGTILGFQSKWLFFTPGALILFELVNHNSKVFFLRGILIRLLSDPS